MNLNLLLAAAIGFYQWSGVGPRAERADLLTQARQHATAAGAVARLRVLHGFEISLVNLKITREGTRFRKSARGEWNALALETRLC